MQENHSNIFEVIKKRRSVRSFSPRRVEREKIIRCVEAASFAPSADNIQPWRFILIDDPELKNAFSEKVFHSIYRMTRWASRAPVLMVLLADINLFAHRLGGTFQKMPYHILDIGIAGEHFVLQAQAQGLGTCWIGWFDIRRAERFLDIPGHLQVCELIAVGYPAEGWHPNPKKRKLIGDILYFNGWKKEQDK